MTNPNTDNPILVAGFDVARMTPEELQALARWAEADDLGSGPDPTKGGLALMFDTISRCVTVLRCMGEDEGEIRGFVMAMSHDHAAEHAGRLPPDRPFPRDDFMALVRAALDQLLGCPAESHTSHTTPED